MTVHFNLRRNMYPVRLYTGNLTCVWKMYSLYLAMYLENNLTVYKERFLVIFENTDCIFERIQFTILQHID
jgi:hypothetical protein